MPRREPPRNPAPPLQSDDFSSWKEISSYLGVSVRRAQQWETELGLPVERFNTERRARVRARRSEIDRWLRERTDPVRTLPPPVEIQIAPSPGPVSAAPVTVFDLPTRKPSRTRNWILGSTGGVLLLVTASWFVWPIVRHPASPASAGIVNGELQALDASGRFLWRVGFREGWARLPAIPLPPEKAGVSWRTNTTLIQDVDGDGRVEVLFVFTAAVLNGAPAVNRLICYGADGAERWRYSPGRKTRWQQRQFDSAYAIWWVIGPFSVDGKPRLLVGASNSFFPCQVSMLDAGTGRLLGEYWHFGALLSGVVLDADGDGRVEALLGGVNNPGPGSGSPALVELKLPLPPPRPDVADVFDSARPAEAAYRLFPPIDAFVVDPYPAAVTWMRLDEWGTLQLSVSLGHNYPTKGQAYYTLDPSLSVIDVRADDFLKSHHEELRRAGQLDHALDESETQSWRQLHAYDAMPNANAPSIVSSWATPDASTRPSPRAAAHEGRTRTR